ncbi:MAG: hypothetical protein J3K34DRAFT_417835, partial [Monoraphidium minutum]
MDSSFGGLGSLWPGAPGGGGGACTCDGGMWGSAGGGAGVVLRFEDHSDSLSPFDGGIGASAEGNACAHCGGAAGSPAARRWTAAAAAASAALSPPLSPVKPGSTFLALLINLRRLALTNSPWMTDIELASLAPLAGLRALDVTGCRSITGAGFAALGAPVVLSELVLAGCVGLSDAGALAAASSVGAGLRHLDVSRCGGLGEAGVVALLSAATGLKCLLLAGNRSVGDRALAAAAGLRHLRRLDAALCCGVEDGALARLAGCAALAELSVRGCWRLSEQGVRALLTDSTSLVSLNMEGCYRLYGCQIATTEGFDAQEDPGRPGVLMRRPPSTAAAAAGSGGGVVSRQEKDRI